MMLSLLLYHKDVLVAHFSFEMKSSYCSNDVGCEYGIMSLNEILQIVGKVTILFMQVSNISSAVHRVHETKAPSGVRKTFQKWMSLFMNDPKPSNSTILTVKGLVFRINIKVCPSFVDQNYLISQKSVRFMYLICRSESDKTYLQSTHLKLSNY